MTATDELRAMLDERGVEYYRHEEGEPLRELKEGTDRATSWRLGKASCTVVECEGGTLDVWIDRATPAQAIEATLGPREQPPYDELIEALRRDWDIEASWDGLRRFWYVGLTDEGARKRDEREATLGRGTCHNASNVTDKHGQARFVCSACGAWLDSRMLWNPEYPNGESPFVKDCRLNYCPNCGRRVVEE